MGVAGRKKELSADYHFLPEIFDVRYKNLLKIYENIISTRNNVWSKSGIRLKLLCSIRPGYCHKTTFLRYLTFFVFLFFFSPNLCCHPDNLESKIKWNTVYCWVSAWDFDKINWKKYIFWCTKIRGTRSRTRQRSWTS